jgi:hypothetical protein
MEEIQKMDKKHLEIIWDDVCDMIEDAQQIKDEALAEIDEEWEQLTEESEYWGRGFLQEAYRVTATLKARQDAALDEFDKAEQFGARIEDLIAYALME